MSIVNFGELLGGGFNTWKKNMVICVPFILGAIISIAVAICILLPVMFSLFIPFIEQAITNPASMSSPETMSQIFKIISENLILFIGSFIIIIIAGGLIMSFFTAGAIGMAKEAVLTGRTNLSHMTSYGKKKFLSYFCATILVGLIISVGFLFILPVLIDLSANMESLVSTSTPQEVIDIMAPSMGSLILGGFLMFIYIIPMCKVKGHPQHYL